MTSRISSSRSSRRTKNVLVTENARLTQYLQGWEASGAFISRINSGEQFDNILNEAVREGTAGLGANRFCIMLLSDDGTELTISASVGMETEALQPIPVEPGIDLVEAVSSGLPSWLMREIESRESIAVIPVSHLHVQIGVLLATRHGDAFSSGETAVLETFANLTGILHYLTSSPRANASQELVERDLNFAHMLKTRVLPTQTPEVAGYRISVCNHRCLGVSGDFHDFLLLEGDRVAIIVGESSGRGIQASLNVAQIIPRIRGNLASRDTLESCINDLNEQLVLLGQRGLMVSMCIVLIDFRKHEVEMVRVGSTLSFLIRKGEVSDLVESCGTPLGVIGNYDSQSITFSFGRDSSLLLSTDGLNKCADAAGTRLDREGVFSLLEKCETGSDLSLAECVESIVLKQASAVLLEDDITILSIEHTG